GAADHAALEVRHRRAAERDRHAHVAVERGHGAEATRVEVARRGFVPLLDHDDVDAALREVPRDGGPGGAAADDDDLGGVPMPGAHVAPVEGRERRAVPQDTPSYRERTAGSSK